MTLRTSRSGIPPISRKPPIAEELEKLHEKPPRTGNRVPLSRLEKLAILDGLCDGEAPGRIAAQWKISERAVRDFKSRLFDDPLSLFHYNVIDHRGKGTNDRATQNGLIFPQLPLAGLGVQGRA